MKKRTIALVMAAVMLLGVTIGGTIAWLTAQSDDVVNTFTVGDINIELDEAPLNTDGLTLNETADRVKVNNNYKMIPGNELPKDPQVRVLAGSEACWLFVKIEKENNFDHFLHFEVSVNDTDSTDGVTPEWRPLEGVNGVYYREVESLVAATENAEFDILLNNQVKVNELITKAEMDALDGIDADGSTTSPAALAEIAARPKLTFKAYAVQKENVADAVTAWGYVNP